MLREDLKTLISTSGENKFRQFIFLLCRAEGEEDKNIKTIQRYITREAKKKNISIPEFIDHLEGHRETLLKFLEKKEISTIDEAGLVKAPIHSLEQKFGSEPIPGQLSIFDDLENRGLIQEAEKLNIKTTGWDLTRAEDMAIFAIQKIYSKYGYRGNVNKNDNTLVFTLPEYCEAYGVKKYKSGNTERFSQAEKEQALDSFIYLKRKECLIAYNQLDLAATKKEGRQIFNRVETFENIIPKISYLYIGIDGKEIEELYRDRTKKLKGIKITPSEVLLDQIGNYYALLPSNLYLELKEKLPGVKNRHLPLFLQWLGKENGIRRRKDLSSTIVIGFERLSYILRIDTWIEKKRIDDRLMDCFKWAKTLEYLNWYKISRGKTVSKKVTLSININKFKPQKKVEKIIYDSGPKEEFEEAQEREEVEDSESVRKAKEKLKDIRGY